MGKSCTRVVALNKITLNERKDTIWRTKLKVADDCRPVWRVLYKSPTEQKVRWPAVQDPAGSSGSQEFHLKINPTVSVKCPFCQSLETIFHCYIECETLQVLFEALWAVFSHCNERWSETVFIFGVGYKRKDAEKWQKVATAKICSGTS